LVTQSGPNVVATFFQETRQTINAIVSAFDGEDVSASVISSAHERSASASIVRQTTSLFD
jgi:hypothetical protein